MSLRRTWLGWTLLLLAPACGGSGGGGGGTPVPMVQVQGTAAISSTPLAPPVPNANVFVFPIDRAGNPVGAPVAAGTTDLTGAFSLDVPTTAFDDGMVVQVTMGPSPSPIGLAAGNLSAPLTGQTIQIDPATELATRQIVEQLRAEPGHTLADFTPEESSSFVSFDQTVLRHDPTLVAASTDGTVTNLQASLAPTVISTVLAGLSSSGQAVTTDGTYRFVEYFYEFGEDASRSSSQGVLTISSGAATLSNTGTRFLRHADCTASCDRTFTTTPSTPSVGPIAGTVTKGENGFLLFGFPDGFGSVDTTLGSITGDGNTIVFTVVTQNGVGIRIGVKELASATPLNGDYGFASIRADIPGSSMASGSWQSFTSTLDAGVVSMNVPAAGQFGGARDSQPMTQSISCTGGPICSLSALMFGGHFPAPAGFGGVFTSDVAGNVLTTEGGAPETGYGSASGGIYVLQHLDPGANSVGITVGVRKGTGKTAASLNGTWNFTQIEDVFNGPGAAIGGGARTGTVRFKDGSIEFLSGGNSGFTQLGCPCTVALPNHDTFESKGLYTVDGVGNIVLTAFGFGPSYPLFGSLSDDDQVVVLTHSRDTPPPFPAPPGSSFVSVRFFAVATKQ